MKEYKHTEIYEIVHTPVRLDDPQKRVKIEYLGYRARQLESNEIKDWLLAGLELALEKPSNRAIVLRTGNTRR